MKNTASVSEQPPELTSEDQAVSLDQTSVPTTGRRQALKNIRRQLTEEELAQSGTQKMLLEMLEEVETEKEIIKSYVASFHESDKKAAVLGEKLNADRSIEIFFGVGVGLGGTILGLAPSLWATSLIHGTICIAIGIGLIIGSCVGRAVKG
jgi:hypothetical protein